jgi:hypothetical protein
MPGECRGGADEMEVENDSRSRSPTLPLPPPPPMPLMTDVKLLKRERRPDTSDDTEDRDMRGSCREDRPGNDGVEARLESLAVLAGWCQQRGS